MSWVEERIPSERDAKVSDVRKIRDSESFSQKSQNRTEKTARQSCFMKAVMGTLSKIDVSKHLDGSLGATPR